MRTNNKSAEYGIQREFANQDGHGSSATMMCIMLVGFRLYSPWSLTPVLSMEAETTVKSAQNEACIRVFLSHASRNSPVGTFGL